MIQKKVSKGLKTTAAPPARGARPDYYRTVAPAELSRRESREEDNSLTDIIVGVGLGMAIDSIFSSDSSSDNSSSDSSSSFDGFGGGDFGGGGSGGDF